MKRIFTFCCILIAISCSRSQENNNTKALIITNVNLIDVIKGEVVENLHVVIDSGKIKSITRNIENIRDFSIKIDGRDKFLMPGLAEMHAHIPQSPTSMERTEEVLFLYLSNGITTIRGMLGHPSHLQLRQKANNGEILSPRIFTSSPSLNGNSVTSKEEAIEKVSAYHKKGYDFLKIHPGIQLDVFNQIVETANEVGIDFAGHVPVKVGIHHALKSKYASIDHVDGFL
ncbi:MAG: amidohydrolase family protein, partial [Maribacter sp.]|nr:amidohydrolase family protein [Maribacter sp.]